MTNVVFLTNAQFQFYSRITNEPLHSIISEQSTRPDWNQLDQKININLIEDFEVDQNYLRSNRLNWGELDLTEVTSTTVLVKLPS